jgi:hypothetical protein
VAKKSKIATTQFSFNFLKINLAFTMKLTSFITSAALLLTSASSSYAQVGAGACNSKLFVSANTQALIESYRELVTKSGVVSCEYLPGSTYYCVTEAMPAKGYNRGCYDGSCSR